MYQENGEFPQSHGKPDCLMFRLNIFGLFLFYVHVGEITSGKRVRETPDTHGYVESDTITNNNKDVLLVEDSVTTDAGGVKFKSKQ